MKINLTSTLTYYINLESAARSKQDLHVLLRRNKFKDFRRAPGFPNSTKFNGVSQAHRNVLASLQDYDKPFLVLEDDVDLNKFTRTITVPDDADAFYLGVSCMGAYNGTHQEQISVSKHSRNIYKIHNMLAAHAVIYLNPDYIKEIIRVIDYCEANNIPHDIGMAEVMKYWNVYGLNKPMFYQKGRYEKYTNKPIEDMKFVGPAEASIFLKDNSGA